MHEISPSPSCTSILPCMPMVTASKQIMFFLKFHIPNQKTRDQSLILHDMHRFKTFIKLEKQTSLDMTHQP